LPAAITSEGKINKPVLEELKKVIKAYLRATMEE
jgi:hypothetical protein